MNHQTGSWGPGETVISSDAPNNYFGAGVARQVKELLVGTPGTNQVQVFQNGILTQTLSPSNGAAGFGSSVVISGKNIVVAAYNQIFLFSKQGDTWIEQSNYSVEGQFFAAGATGTGIAMHGNTLAVLGRKGTDSRIYVFKVSGGYMGLQTMIDLEYEDLFLWDIDIQGERIVANGGANAGFGILFAPQVYIFEPSNNDYGISAQVAFPVGYMLARNIALDNSTIVANTAFGFNGGTKSIVVTASGGGWSIDAELEQPGPLPFGNRMIDVQGSKAIVTISTGSFNQDPNDAAHVFERVGSSWILTQTLTPSMGGSDYLFGESVQIYGNEVVIGAPGSGSFSAGTPPPPGAVFIYK